MTADPDSIYWVRDWRRSHLRRQSLPFLPESCLLHRFKSRRTPKPRIPMAPLRSCCQDQHSSPSYVSIMTNSRNHAVHPGVTSDVVMSVSPCFTDSNPEEYRTPKHKSMRHNSTIISPLAGESVSEGEAHTHLNPLPSSDRRLGSQVQSQKRPDSEESPPQCVT